MKLQQIREDVVPFGKRKEGYQVILADPHTGVHFARGKVDGFPQHIQATPQKALEYLKAFAHKWNDNITIAPVPSEEWDHAAEKIAKPHDGKVWGAYNDGGSTEEQLWIVSTNTIGDMDERHLNATSTDDIVKDPRHGATGKSWSHNRQKHIDDMEDKPKHGIDGIRDVVGREEKMNRVADHATDDQRDKDEFRPFMPRPGTNVKKKPHLRSVK